MDANTLLAGASLILFAAFIGYFGYVIYHQQQVEPDEKPVYGVELLRQHYAPGDTVEQPTPYWVAPIPSAPDPLEISGNLDRKIIAGGAMLFALSCCRSFRGPRTYARSVRRSSWRPRSTVARTSTRTSASTATAVPALGTARPAPTASRSPGSRSTSRTSRPSR